MPQISQIAATYASQIFWLLITFGLLYFVVGRGMVPRIVATVDMREARIAADLTAAEAARKVADQTEEAWRLATDAARAAAQADIAAAKAQAARTSETQLAHADAELTERLAHHEVAIANAKAKAMANLQDIAADATQTLVAKLAGIEVSVEAASEAVRKTHG